MFELFSPNQNIDFLKQSKVAIGISAALIVVSVASFVVRGFNWGIDFRGGILIQAHFERDLTAGEVEEGALELGLGRVQVQSFEGSKREFLIRIDTEDRAEEAEEIVQQGAIETSLRDTFGPGTKVARAEMVGPKVGAELVQRGALALMWALLAVLIYIWFRFTLDFGVGAIVAVFHDVTIMLGAFSLTRGEINLPVVAALLTIVGYSVNDTIVLFDRVRENLARHRKTPYEGLVNQSVNETLSRTLLTSLTVLMSSFALLFFGGGVLHDFAFAMVVGTLSGTWSTVYIASPVSIWMRKRGWGGRGKS